MILETLGAFNFKSIRFDVMLANMSEEMFLKNPRF